MAKRYINPDEKWELLKQEILKEISTIDKKTEKHSDEPPYWWWEDMMEVKDLILSQK